MRKQVPPETLTAGHGAEDYKGFSATGDRVGEGSVRRIVGEVLFAGEEADKGSAFLGDVIADRSSQDWIARLESVENSALCYRAIHFQLHLAIHASELSQMEWERNVDHGSVWTSTERTAGRSRTIGFQVSPASAEP